MLDVKKLEDAHAEVAVEWMAEMASGQISDGQLRAFEAWLDADERNEAAWIRLQESLMPYGVAASRNLSRFDVTRRLLSMRSNRRRFIAGVAGFIGLGSAGLLATDRFLPINALMADHFTLTGQHERVQLADGSEILLGPRAAVNVRYASHLRSVSLLEGQIMVKVVPDLATFQLDVASMQLKTDDGTFVVQRRPDSMSVTGVEGAGFLNSEPVTKVSPNMRVVMRQGRLERETVDAQTEAAWTDGLLVAKDRTIASIVDELRPYFSGVIRVSPDVANVRATAVLKLDDPNASLEALANSLNLRVRRFSTYWVSIGPTNA